jgi:hypothetical protein
MSLSVSVLIGSTTSAANSGATQLSSLLCARQSVDSGRLMPVQSINALSSPIAFFTVHDFPVQRSPLIDKDSAVGRDDQTAIRAVIESQIAALRQGDFTKAFSFASPTVQKEVGSPQSFVEMVKSSYEQVIGPRSIVFEDLKQVMGIVTQPVLLFSQNGDLVIASYMMEKQENGDWKINGCYLAPVK